MKRSLKLKAENKELKVNLEAAAAALETAQGGSAKGEAALKLQVQRMAEECAYVFVLRFCSYAGSLIALN